MSDSRRDFLKKAAYTAPAILSLQAYSAAAKAGSGKGGPPPGVPPKGPPTWVPGPPPGRPRVS